MHGGMVWGNTYRLRPNDDTAAFLAVSHRMLETGTVDLVDVNGQPVIQPTHDTYVLTSAGRWVDGGCRMIETDARYFAAMAATKVSDAATIDLRVPWPAFVVNVPAGLLVASDGAEYRHILVSQLQNVPGIQSRHDSTPCERPWTVFAMFTEFEGDKLTSITVGTISESAQEKLPFVTDFGATEADGDDGIIEMCKRAVVGLLLTMQHTAFFRTKAFSGVSRGKYRDAPPPHRVIFIGRPIALDCTQAVRDRASGRRNSTPSVQVLVRGHYKRQVVGIGRAGRKVVWVKPYWRGPEDAPILSSPIRVGSAQH